MGDLDFGDPRKLAICTLPFSFNFGDFLHSNHSQIGDFGDFQILVIYNLDFGDFDFGNVLLGPKNRQNRGITVLDSMIVANLLVMVVELADL